MDREVKELEKALEQIWEIAIKFGLDPFPVHFEVVPATVMYEVGSYALPGRYSHWTFGKAYHRMKMMYDFGLSRIYEVVINTNPSYGFLLETNSLTQNKLVMAHVLGHVDFFKNNAYFSRTNRRMVDEVSIHAARISEYEFKYGRKAVEEFLDAVLSIEEHVDPDFFIKKARNLSSEQRKRKPAAPGKFDDLLAPEERKKAEPPHKFQAPDAPVLPEKDLVWFISQYSPTLEPWQREVMEMVHQEMLYFVPQMQTKILNEGWACATGDSWLLTEHGLIRFDELYADHQKIQVASGGTGQVNSITDFHKEEQVPTIRIKTSCGLTIEGALKHRILLADGRWAYLRDVKPGDHIALEVGSNVWPKEKQVLSQAVSEPTATLNQMATLAGVSIWTALRHLKRRPARNSTRFTTALTTPAYQTGRAGKLLPAQVRLRTCEVLHEDLAWLLGYFVGNGQQTTSGICFITGDDELVPKLNNLIVTSLGLKPIVYWDPVENNGQRGRWQVMVHSRELLNWFQALGISLQETAAATKIPTLILRSPKEVMSAFLRGYFDANADVGEGIQLSSASEEFIRTVQVILLNYGILSTQQPCPDGWTQLYISGVSARRFYEEIGFSRSHKQEALRRYVENYQRFPKEDPTDSIVSIEYGCTDVFDITVETKHAYVANGMVNHNSFWHSRIMRELGLEGDEYIEFAELHAGVVSPHKGQLNPYFIGYKMLEDIERRWDNPTQEEREKYGRKGGEGRQKLFEVREVENDISFLRNYLTEQLCEELDLYVFELVEEEEWTITEKRWERVRDQLVASKTNFGFPYIEVTDADYNGNRELYLNHRFEGAELDLKYARKVLEYVHRLWGRTVHLETKVDNDSLVLHYNGKEHEED